MFDLLPIINVAGKNPEEQVAQIVNYLSSFVDELEFILSNINIDNLSPDMRAKLAEMQAAFASNTGKIDVNEELATTAKKSAKKASSDASEALTKAETGYQHAQTTGNPHNTTAADVGALPDTTVIPVVPAWALEPTKPTYTASEVGAYAINSNVSINSNGVTAYNDPTHATKSISYCSEHINFYQSNNGALKITNLYPNNSSNANYSSVYLPESSGTLALTDDIPSVPAWALEDTKPTYTATEVGALPDTTIIPDVPAWALEANKPTYTAAEVGALPDTTEIPTRVSDLSDADEYAKKSDVPGAGPVNLIPYPYFNTTKTASNCTITDNGDGTLTVTTSAATTAATSFTLFDTRTTTQTMLCEAGKTYTLSWNLNGTRSGLYLATQFYDANKSYISGSRKYVYEDTGSNTVTLPSNAAYMICYITVPAGYNSTVTIKPMLEEGTTAHEYVEFKNTDNVYCYAERLVGRWLNGQEMYQKTFIITLDTTTGLRTVSLPLTPGATEMVDIHQIVRFSSGSLSNLPYINTTYTPGDIRTETTQIVGDSPSISVYTGMSRNGTKIYLTVRYLK